MSVKVDIDPDYVEQLEEQLRQVRRERDEARANERRMRQCYDEEHQFVLDAKIQKCQLAEYKDEIERLKAQLAIATGANHD